MNAHLRDLITVRSTSSELLYNPFIFSFSYLSFPPLFLSPFCYLVTSPVPTCLVHNCETSRRLLYFHLLSPLSQDQISLWSSSTAPFLNTKWPLPTLLILLQESSLDNRQVSSLLSGCRQRWWSRVILLSSVLSLSSLLSASHFTFSISLSISSMSSYFSRAQLSSTAIAMQLHNGLTLLILL